MAIEVKVPSVGESVTAAMITEWLVAEGDRVEEDQDLVTLETDKVDQTIPSPAAGVIQEIRKQDGDDVEVGEVIAILQAADGSAPAPEAAGGESAQADATDAPAGEAAPAEADGSADAASEDQAPEPSDNAGDEVRVMPAARRLLTDHGLDAADIAATGPGGRLLKEDVQRHLDAAETPAAAPAPAAAPPPAASGAAPAPTARAEEIVRMTPLRRRVAATLVGAQQTAALLTTFNEIDMSAVIALRKQYQPIFVDKHGIKLGFMSFFVKAVVEALKDVPQVNAEIRGNEIVYRNYQDIGVAVGGGKGLVVPVIRNAERLSFAGVETSIADLASRAKDGSLTMDELRGGTFTISNGGIYGSLLSTPIVNPPQSGILGMHKIEERPVAVDGEVVIRPMMYVALTYDHRLIDGREAVTFLVKVKERIEDPQRILLEI
ncbi:MAG: 2-oxoglutarate dehydrogenase complex dihydrolipoyllysine-residue succinyltransferase [Acidobacteriota bacterium]